MPLAFCKLAVMLSTMHARPPWDVHPISNASEFHIEWKHSAIYQYTKASFNPTNQKDHQIKLYGEQEETKKPADKLRCRNMNTQSL